MTNLISEKYRNAMRSAMQDIHDTFSRPIYYFKEAKTVVLSTQPSYNPIYQQNSVTQQTFKRITQSGSFNARIQYDTDKSTDQFSSYQVNSQLKLKLPDGYVRIKVDYCGYEQLKSTKRLDFDGRRFSVESDVRPHGLFRPQHFTFYLLPTEEASAGTELKDIVGYPLGECQASVNDVVAYPETSSSDTTSDTNDGISTLGIENVSNGIFEQGPNASFSSLYSNGSSLKSKLDLNFSS